MIQLKPINYTNASSIDVESIVQNFELLAREIEEGRTRENVLPTGFGSISCPIDRRGTHVVIPAPRMRLDVISAHCVLGDNIRRVVKIHLYLNEKKLASVKFASERSGKLQIFDLPDDLEMGTYDILSARLTDDRRVIVSAAFASKEDETDG